MRRPGLSPEEWAGHARFVLGLTDYPTDADVWKVLAQAMNEGKVLWEYRDIPYSHTVPAKGGGGLIRISTRVDERQQTADLLEELGHCFLSGLCLGGCSGTRMVLKGVDRDEAAVARFVLAWKLPWEMLCRDGLDEDLILARSGCSRGELAERLEHYYR